MNDLFTTNIKQLTADFISGKVKELTSQEAFFIQRRLFAMKRWADMRRVGEICTKRLEQKNNVYLKGYGWIRKELIPHSGLILKNGTWIIGDIQKFKAFVSTK